MTPSEVNRMERIVALLSLGIKQALSGKYISIDEAEVLLFSPRTMAGLRNIGASDDVVTLIHYGTELENIERLLPEKLDRKTERIGELAIGVLRSSTNSDPQLDDWFFPLCKDSADDDIAST